MSKNEKKKNKKKPKKEESPARRFSDILRGRIQKDRYQEQYRKEVGEELFKGR